MKATIYLFSATGNTALVAEEYKKNLEEKGIETTVSRIEDNQIVDSDIIGFAFPIHAFSAPENVIKFARALPDDNKEIFFLKSGGECLKFNDASGAKLRSVLTKKGYSVIADNLYVMPYNMLYRHSDSMATKMYFTMKRKVKSDVDDLVANRRKPIGKGTIVSFVFRNVEQPFMHLNGRLFKVNEDKCVGCNKCVNNCPQKNISVKDGKITFGKNCIGCVRCSFNCPTDAINIGILNMWKVNGKYKFADEEPEEYEVKYLKKSYAKYFNEN